MEGTALRINTITFRTQSSLPEEVDTPSDAALFDHLLGQKLRILVTMLSFAYILVTPKVMEALREKWPESKAVQEVQKIIQEEGGHEYFSNGSFNFPLYFGIDFAQQFAIQEDLMELLRDSPSFDELISTGYTKSNWCRWQEKAGLSDEEMSEEWDGRNFDKEADDDFLDPDMGLLMYTADTRYTMFDWRPALWWIPERRDPLGSFRCAVYTGALERVNSLEGVSGRLADVVYPRHW